LSAGNSLETKKAIPKNRFKKKIKQLQERIRRGELRYENYL